MYSFSDSLLTKTLTFQAAYTLKNSSYLLCATQRGRLYLADALKKKILYRICSFKGSKKSYIGIVESLQNYIACSGYGGEIKIIYLPSLKVVQEIQSSHSRITALLYLNKNLLLSGNVQGTFEIHNLQNKTSKEISTPFSRINSIIKLPSQDSVAVSGDDNRVILININTEKVITNNFLQTELPISSLELLNPSTLLVKLQNNTAQEFKLALESDLQNSLEQESLKDSYALLEHFSYLKTTPTATEIESLYKKLYSKAINALIDSNEEPYLYLYESLDSFEKKSQELKNLYMAYEAYDKFEIFIKEQKYALAYALSEKYPALKETELFSIMEKQFKSLTLQAQKFLQKGDSESARELLSPYMSITQKQEQLQLLLRNNTHFIEFLQAVAYKEYATISKLLKENKSFSNIPSYQALIKESQTILEDIRDFILQAKPKKAIELIKRYQNNFLITQELKELYKDALDAKLLLESYEESDFLRCYELLDSNDFLHDLELSKLLEMHWIKLMTLCEGYALEGNIADIKKSLNELILLKSRSNRIGAILRLAFHTQIELLLEKKRFSSAESLIYSYLDIFGMDKEIGIIMHYYEKVATKKLAITLAQNHTLPRDYWMGCESLVK